MEFHREVQKIKEVKLFATRHPDLFQHLETFILVSLFCSLKKRQAI